MGGHRRSEHVDAEHERGIAHVPALDGLRGVAVVAVVGYHFAPEAVPGGFLGVDLFFVLSGFLITSLLVAEHARTAHISFAAFWVRRARRLLPALFLVLLAVAAYGVGAAQPLEARQLRGDGLAALGYFANWHFLASGESYIADFVGLGPSPLRHTWSLAIEEQFYLVWPLVVGGLAIACRWRGRGLRPALTGLCVVLAIASASAMATVHDAGDDPSRVYYGTDTHAQLILLGAALGALTAGRVRTGPRLGRALSVSSMIVTGALLVMIFSATDTSDWLYEGGYSLVGLAAVVLIAGVTRVGDRSLVARLLRTRVLVGLGLVSYGIYLWHWPVQLWIDEDATGVSGFSLFVLRSAVTLAVAGASFMLVERPIRQGVLRRAGRWVPRVVVPASVLLVAAAVVAPVVTASAPDGPPRSQISTVSELLAAENEYAQAATCDRATEPDTVPHTLAPEVLLIGNSVANEINECLAVILDAEGHELESDVVSGEALCTMLPRLSRAVREGQRPKFVVVYSLKVGFGLSVCWTRDGLGEPAVTDAWMEDVTAVVELYAGVGAHVFLVPPALDAGLTGDDVLRSRFEELVVRFPGQVEVIDAHRFIRDEARQYQMWMPCVDEEEPGCQDGYVQVRLAADGGSHFCTATDAGIDIGDGPCPAQHAAGVRRVAAGVASAILPAIDRLEAPVIAPPLG